MNERTMLRLLVWAAAALLALGVAACEEGDDDDDGTGPDAGGADGGDSDADSDADVCEPPFEWGSGLEQYEIPANWELTGYIDADGDGLVEEEEVEFTLEDIHCMGVQSLVVIVGDTG
jgi:hypothetical protein